MDSFLYVETIFRTSNHPYQDVLKNKIAVLLKRWENEREQA